MRMSTGLSMSAEKPWLLPSFPAGSRWQVMLLQVQWKLQE